MTYAISKTGHFIDGVAMYRVRDGRNGPSYGPIDGRKSWPHAKAIAICQLANELREQEPARRQALQRLTLAQAAEQFIERKQATGSHDQEHYRLPWLRRHVIGRTQLRRLTTAQCARWRDWLLAQGNKPEGVRKLLSLASAVVQDAIERGRGPKHNPFREVSRPARAQKAAPRVMSVEHERMLSGLRSRSRCIVLVLLWSGLRRGELMALELGDVAECSEGYWLDVHRGRVGSKRTKTNKRRRVLLWGPGAAALSEWLSEHRPALKQRARGHERVFPVCLGRYIAASVWASAGLPPYSPNELRHTHSTGLTTGRWCYRWGRPEAAARMGHSTAVQDKHYLNATGGPAAEASRAAAAAWRQRGATENTSQTATLGESPSVATLSERSDHHALANPRANGRTPIDGQPAAAEPSTRSRAGNGAYMETASAPLDPRRAGACAVSPQQPIGMSDVQTGNTHTHAGRLGRDLSPGTDLRERDTVRSVRELPVLSRTNEGDSGANSAPVDPVNNTGLIADNPWKLLGRARCDSNARLLASEARNQSFQALGNVSSTWRAESIGAATGAESRLAAQVIAADAIGNTGAAAEYGVALAHAVLARVGMERTA